MATASVVRVQLSDRQVFECPECSALLWWTFCERCGGHYECECCEHVFILKSDGWYRLMPDDSLPKVGA
jgi:predicted nucleic acid-binding Zn ribbon protein